MKAPSWQQLLGGTGATFLVIGAILAGRVNAGTDPAVKRIQANRAASAATTQTQTTQTQTTTGSRYDDGLGSSSSQQSNPTTTQAS